MKEHPIIFSTQLIPAILDGSKTQTRRTRGLEEINKNPDDWHRIYLDDSRGYVATRRFQGMTEECVIGWCPYGQVGDRLWVKETWAIAAYTPNKVVDVIYKADDGIERFDIKHVAWFDGLKMPKNCDIWHGGRFMPRWASRIDRDITEVRLERLNSITDTDAIAEGIKPSEYAFRMVSGDVDATESPRELFAELWDSINAKRYPWDMNPYVWVIGSKREMPKGE